MKLYELFSQPGTWTQGFYARDSEGGPASTLSEKAICWCLEGAIFRIPDCETRWDTRGKIRAHIGSDIPRYNDAPERTQEEIYALCKELDV